MTLYMKCDLDNDGGSDGGAGVVDFALLPELSDVESGTFVFMLIFCQNTCGVGVGVDAVVCQLVGNNSEFSNSMSAGLSGFQDFYATPHLHPAPHYSHSEYSDQYMQCWRWCCRVPTRQ